MSAPAGRSPTSTDLRDIIYRDSGKKTVPALLPSTQIGNLVEFAHQRLEEVAKEAGLAVVSGDASDETRFLATLAPFVEEAEHLRYVIEFLYDRSAGSIGPTMT